MPVRIWLPYGPGRMLFVASEETAVYCPGVRPAISQSAEVRSALEAPVSSERLASLARGAKSACVVLSDHTRSTGAKVVVPAVLDELGRAGVSPAKVSYLIAYGNHPRAEDAELEAALGVLPSRVIHHDSADDSNLTEVGVLPSGAPLRLNRTLVEADVVVLTGSVTFHYHAGFTGGRKSVLPGAASRENVLANHALILGERERRKECAPGVLDGNPVHEEMLAGARFLERAFIVNTVMTPGGGIARVFAGDIEHAHRAACEFVGRGFRLRADRKHDTVVASAGGWPHDRSFYQAHKAVQHAAPMVRDGGLLVLVAECAEGVGAPSMLDWMKHADSASHFAALKEKFEVPGQTALALRDVLSRIRVSIVGVMDPGEARTLGIEPARTLRDALGGDGASEAAVVPHAAVTLMEAAE